MPLSRNNCSALHDLCLPSGAFFSTPLGNCQAFTEGADGRDIVFNLQKEQHAGLLQLPHDHALECRLQSNFLNAVLPPQMAKKLAATNGRFVRPADRLARAE